MTLQQNKILLFAALFFAALGLNAQGDIIQVVTKKVEKHFSFKDGYELNVEGEKALVTIDTWDKDEIFVTLELVSKHTDAKVAEKDLEALNYVMKRIKNKVYLRNFLASEDGVRVKVSSTLLIKYKIFLPDNCPVYIKNHFGEAHVAQLKNSLKINSEYSKITLNDIFGVLNISTRFGDLKGQRINGDMSIISRRSDITLTDIRGHFDIQAQYGTIFISSNDELLDLNIEAKKTDVVLSLPDPQLYGYKLSAKNGKIDLPTQFSANTIQSSDYYQQVDVKPGSDYYPSIKVSVIIGNIKVKKTKL